MSTHIARSLLPCLLAAMAIGSLAGCRSAGPLRTLENSVVFAPTTYPTGNWQPTGVNFEDAWFTADDGTKLHGWYVPHENPRAVVLYAHGNAGNLSDRAYLLPVLHDQLDLSVMMFDYRGYGRSEGSPDEQGILRDARAARTWLARRVGIAENDIVLMGRSLGGAVAIDMAAADGARGLIIESTFTSLPDMAGELLPMTPAKWLMSNWLDSLDKISKYRGPLLHSHGRDDSLIPFEQGQQLFAAANQPKRFLAIPGTDHNDQQPAGYYRAVDAFIDQLPKPKRPIAVRETIPSLDIKLLGHETITSRRDRIDRVVR